MFQEKQGGTVKDDEKTRDELIGEIRVLREQIKNLSELNEKSRQVEEELKSSEEKFKALFEYAPDAYYINDLKGNFLDGNRAAEKLIGYDRSELIGKNMLGLRILPFNQILKVSGILAKNVMGISTGPDEIDLYRKDGAHVTIEVRAIPIKMKGQLVVLGIARDITERRSSEYALRESEEKFRVLSETSISAIFLHRGEKLIYANPAAEKMTGYSKEELLNMKFSDIVHPDFKKLVEDRAYSRLQGKSVPSRYEFKILTKSGEGRWADVTASIIEYKGKPSVMATIFDNTERKKDEEELQLTQFAIDRFKDAALWIAPDASILNVNIRACEMLGYSRDELLKMKIFDIDKSTKEKSWNKCWNHLKKIRSSTKELEYITKDGVIFPAEVTANFLDFNGRELNFAIVRDITERKRAEIQILKSLNEKEVLLKEIHHRVKNNLQIISSLLNLQKEYIKDKEALDIFIESQNRVKTMALIHEKLYQSNDLARIDFNEYLKGLTAYMFRSYGIDKTVIGLDISVKNIFLNIDMAVPCALIINELISNSLKHAFPEDMKGEINIEMSMNGSMSLVFSDNGIGLPDGFDFRNTTSLGFQLVNVLTEQLNGSIELDGRNGTKFTIEFPAFIE
ncbi:PAS domain S-box protein [Methanooceanicella nereidis]|uniref:PAS domain S-box protein n=1 Tax=Methanooceanicella nereidis TaxID=2052831 RepID=UPI001E2D5D0D